MTELQVLLRSVSETDFKLNSPEFWPAVFFNLPQQHTCIQEAKASMEQLSGPVDGALSRRDQMVSAARPLQGQKIHDTALLLKTNWDKLTKLHQDRLRRWEESNAKWQKLVAEQTALEAWLTEAESALSLEERNPDTERQHLRDLTEEVPSKEEVLARVAAGGKEVSQLSTPDDASADARSAAVALQEDLGSMVVWLDQADGVLALPLQPAEPQHIRDTLAQVQVSRDLPERQLEAEALLRDLERLQGQLEDLSTWASNTRTRLEHSPEDLEPRVKHAQLKENWFLILELMRQHRERMTLLVARKSQVTLAGSGQPDSAVALAQFHKAWAELTDWLSMLDHMVQNKRVVASLQDMEQRRPLLEKQLTAHWEDSQTKLSDRTKQLHNMQQDSTHWLETRRKVEPLIQLANERMAAWTEVTYTVEALRKQNAELKGLVKDLAQWGVTVDQCNGQADGLLRQYSTDDTHLVRHLHDNQTSTWAHINQRACDREEVLDGALRRVQQLHLDLERFLTWLTEAETTCNVLVDHTTQERLQEQPHAAKNLLVQWK
ncbi:hypothetical protein NHX12_015161, partial [Muraenolepis orangiensis]